MQQGPIIDRNHREIYKFEFTEGRKENSINLTIFNEVLAYVFYVNNLTYSSFEVKYSQKFDTLEWDFSVARYVIRYS